MRVFVDSDAYDAIVVESQAPGALHPTREALVRAIAANAMPLLAACIACGHHVLARRICSFVGECLDGDTGTLGDVTEWSAMHVAVILDEDHVNDLINAIATRDDLVRAFSGMLALVEGRASGN